MNTIDTRSSSKPPDHDRSRRRTVTFLLVGAAVPMLAVIASVIAQLAVRSRLPDPIASHWGLGGEPDGWSSPWVPLVMTIAIGLGVPAILVASSLLPLRSGSPGQSVRLLAAISAGSAVGMSFLFAHMVVGQADGGSVNPGTSVGLMVVIAILVGVAGWLVMPKDAARTPTPATPLPIRRGEKLVWVGTSAVGRGVALIVGASLAVAVVMAFITGLGGSISSGALPAIILVAATVVVMATTVYYHVRIDADGLTVRSVIGLPRFHIRAADIESVAAIQVQAIGDFGGYGIRYRKGSLGVVLRSGPAVEVTRTNGRRFVVTVNDAETAAGVLASVAATQR